MEFEQEQAKVEAIQEEIATLQEEIADLGRLLKEARGKTDLYRQIADVAERLGDAYAKLRTGLRTSQAQAVPSFVYDQGIIVPAYMSPGDTSSWLKIIEAGIIVEIVVLNYSFIGSDFDPNNRQTHDAYVNARNLFSMLVANGHTRLFGYVCTDGGRNQITPWTTLKIEQDIGTWYGRYGDHLGGMFLDVGPTLNDTVTCDGRTATHVGEDSQKAFYERLYDYMKITYGSEQNNVLINASHFRNSWVMDYADYAVVWEGTYDNYNTSLAPQGFVTWGVPDWWRLFPPKKIAHVIFNCQGTAALDDAVLLSKQRNAGLLYVHDTNDTDTTADYTRLPTYWQREVRGVIGPVGGMHKR